MALAKTRDRPRLRVRRTTLGEYRIEDENGVRILPPADAEVWLAAWRDKQPAERPADAEECRSWAVAALAWADHLHEEEEEERV
jgi:hypothetical protein